MTETGKTTEEPGLSDDEVASRVAAGQTNSNVDPRTKTVGRIVAEHVLTLFNGVNLLLALLVLSTGSLRNLLFVWVVLANLAIGVFQEIRSKMIVDRLSVLAARPVSVRRGGARCEVAVEQVVLDDLLLLSHGSQVPADAEVVSGCASMNESLLTGESVPVAKGVGDVLLSGSFVDSGSLVARVTCVGAEGYAARINAEAKYVKRVNSQIMGTLKMIIRCSTILMGPLGIGLYLRTVATGETMAASTLTTVAALVGMIPQGLVLLTSTVLAISTARLARQQVLVQQLYCIETLARVDVLCLDKTGTITSGAMEVMAVEGVEHDEGGFDVESALASIVCSQADDANETAKALLSFVGERDIVPEKVARAVPFSSSRKYSGCVTASGRALVMGAAQFVLGSALDEEVRARLGSFGRTARVLVLAETDGFDETGSLQGRPRLLGYVSIRDQVRPNAARTIAFFKAQDVRLNVISGDDPLTVSAIAESVGVPDADEFVDATTLDTHEKLVRAAERCRVFGRVTPQQKRELVSILKEQGHTVAMTGDGVNDVLALKEADCSVAMASGSDAARNVAEVVLVDNDFAHMPQVVDEGRRSINNLQRSASLFLVKTIFSAALALVCIINPPYPFLPVQMSLLSASIIGVPSFVLALESNHDRVTGNFLGNVLSRSIPAAILIVVAVGFTTCSSGLFGFDFAQTSTLCMLITAVIGLALILRISLPLNPLRAALLVLCTLMVMAGSTVGAPFFEVSALTFQMWVFFLVMSAICLVSFTFLFDRCAAANAEGTTYTRFMRDMEDKHGKQRP